MTPMEVHEFLEREYEKPIRGVWYLSNKNIISITATNYNDLFKRYDLDLNPYYSSRSAVNHESALNCVPNSYYPFGRGKDNRRKVYLEFDSDNLLNLVFPTEIDKASLGCVPQHAKALISLFSEYSEFFRAGSIYRIDPGPSKGYRATVHIPIYPYTFEGKEEDIIVDLDVNNYSPIIVTSSIEGLNLDI